MVRMPITILLADSYDDTLWNNFSDLDLGRYTLLLLTAEEEEQEEET